jgi:hypothetical protein
MGAARHPFARPHAIVFDGVRDDATDQAAASAD